MKYYNKWDQYLTNGVYIFNGVHNFNQFISNSPKQPSYNIQSIFINIK